MGADRPRARTDFPSRQQDGQEATLSLGRCPEGASRRSAGRREPACDGWSEGRRAAGRPEEAMGCCEPGGRFGGASAFTTCATRLLHSAPARLSVCRSSGSCSVTRSRRRLQGMRIWTRTQCAARRTRLARQFRPRWAVTPKPMLWRSGSPGIFDRATSGNRNARRPCDPTNCPILTHSRSARMSSRHVRLRYCDPSHSMQAYRGLRRAFRRRASCIGAGSWTSYHICRS